MDLLARFDEQVRRRFVDEDGLHVDDDWGAVLVVPADVDRALARLRRLPGHAEWKFYGHDPPWVAERLQAAGMEPDEEETVLVAEAARLPPPPAEVDLRTDPDAFRRVVAAVFGEAHPLPAEAVTVVAYVDGEPVSAGRVDLDPRSEFAGLFGGATLAEHRGRGYYRATVAKRAELARERGYGWLYVDALPTSRPILERLGFVAITTTTPWTWPTRDPAASSSG